MQRSLVYYGFSECSVDENSMDAIRIILVVFAKMALHYRSLDEIEKIFLEEAVQKVWEQHKKKASVKHIIEYLRNHEDPRAKKLGIILCHSKKGGICSRTLNEPVYLSTQDQGIIFELELMGKTK